MLELDKLNNEELKLWFLIIKQEIKNRTLARKIETKKCLLTNKYPWLEEYGTNFIENKNN